MVVHLTSLSLNEIHSSQIHKDLLYKANCQFHWTIAGVSENKLLNMYLIYSCCKYIQKLNMYLSYIKIKHIQKGYSVLIINFLFRLSQLWSSVIQSLPEANKPKGKGLFVKVIQFSVFKFYVLGNLSDNVNRKCWIYFHWISFFITCKLIHWTKKITGLSYK